MSKAGRPKKTAKAPPPSGRVLGTAGEFAALLFSLDRRRELERVRVAYHEAACAEILRQPKMDPWLVAELQGLLAMARGHLELGFPAGWRMVEIEALASRMNRLSLEPLAAHGKKLMGRRVASYGALRRVLEAYGTANPDASFVAIWDHLYRLQDRMDKTIQEVLDASAKCHPGDHVHWRDAGGRERSTTAKAVRNLMAQIRRTAPPA